MKKKRTAIIQYFREGFEKNQEEILKHTIQLQKHYSLLVAIIFFVYTLSIVVTDYIFWAELYPKVLLGFLVSGVTGVNWWILKKEIPQKRKAAHTATNAFLFVLLQVLAMTEVLSDGTLSYTLVICTILATAVLSLEPVNYSLLILACGLNECVLSFLFLDMPFSTMVYYWVDFLVTALVAVCINFMMNALWYRLFEEKDELKKESAVDPLTGLYTRRYFERFFQFHYRNDELSAMIHLDLDNFKTLNDTLGHQHGDAMLVRVAKLLRERFRKMDCVSRMGGDEFMVYMASLSETRHTMEKVRQILNCFPITVREGDVEVQVSASIGVAFSGGGRDWEYQELYQMADAAMYRAKKAGKGRAVIALGGESEEIMLVSKSV